MSENEESIKLGVLLGDLQDDDERKRRAALSGLRTHFEGGIIPGRWKPPMDEDEGIGLNAESDRLLDEYEAKGLNLCICDPCGQSMTAEEIAEIREHAKKHYPADVEIIEVTTEEGYLTVAIIGLTAKEANAIDAAVARKAELDAEQNIGLTEEKRLEDLENWLERVKTEKDSAFGQLQGLSFDGEYVAAGSVALQEGQNPTEPYCLLGSPQAKLEEEELVAKVTYWQEHYPDAKIERVTTADNLEIIAVIGLTEVEANTITASVHARDELRDRLGEPSPSAQKTTASIADSPESFDAKVKFYASLPAEEARALMAEERARF